MGVLSSGTLVRAAVLQRCQLLGFGDSTLLTFMAALAAGLDVDLMSLTRRRPSGGDRLLALQIGLLFGHATGWPRRPVRQ